MVLTRDPRDPFTFVDQFDPWPMTRWPIVCSGVEIDTWPCRSYRFVSRLSTVVLWWRSAKPTARRMWWSRCRSQCLRHLQAGVTSDFATPAQWPYTDVATWTRPSHHFQVALFPDPPVVIIHCVPKKVTPKFKSLYLRQILSELIFLLATLIITKHFRFQQNPPHGFWATAFKKMELKNRFIQYGKYRLAYLLQKVLRMT